MDVSVPLDTLQALSQPRRKWAVDLQATAQASWRILKESKTSSGRLT